MGSFTLATTNNEDIGGVICSFAPHWQTAVHDGSVRVVFRKKKLVTTSPEWLYVYMASPVTAITAKLSIVSLESMAVSEALKLAEKGSIAVDELRKYAGKADELFVIHVGVVQVAKTPIEMSVLSSKYGFFPSPNFIRLSKSGASTIDRLANFKGKD